MKKQIILLAAVLSGIFAQQTFAQGNGDLLYIPFSHITGDEMEYFTIDYTTFEMGGPQYSEVEGGAYRAVLPFVVEEPIPAGELFWLALYAPQGSSFESWGIYVADDDLTFICKDWQTYYDDYARYIIQSQDNLTQKITTGEYILMVQFEREPQPEEVWISVGYSTRQWYDNYSAHLARLQQEFYDSASPYGADNVVKTAVAEPEDQGIHAGGLTWATKNVGAAKPSDYGNYYTWQEAMVVCPAGWRLPTMDEWSTLMRTTGYNLLDNGAWVGDRQLYLPFAGYIISGGRYSRVGEIGNYWTSNEFEDDKRNAINFAIWSEKWSTGGGKDKSYKYPVRCVKDNDLDIDWDDFEDWMWMLL